jgi:hypothetical protein
VSDGFEPQFIVGVVGSSSLPKTEPVLWRNPPLVSLHK